MKARTSRPPSRWEGKSLQLVGAGLREKGFFDVYALGAYTQSGSCDPQKIIKDDETKYLRIEMLRNVKADAMASSIGDAFDDAIPPGADPNLKAQSATFQGYFKDKARKDQVIDFTYVPEVGVTIRQDGKELGPPLTGETVSRGLLVDLFQRQDLLQRSAGTDSRKLQVDRHPAWFTHFEGCASVPP